MRRATSSEQLHAPSTVVTAGRFRCCSFLRLQNSARPALLHLRKLNHFHDTTFHRRNSPMN